MTSIHVLEAGSIIVSILRRFTDAGTSMIWLSISYALICRGWRWSLRYVLFHLHQHSWLNVAEQVAHISIAGLAGRGRSNTGTVVRLFDSLCLRLLLVEVRGALASVCWRNLHHIRIHSCLCNVPSQLAKRGHRRWFLLAVVRDIVWAIHLLLLRWSSSSIEHLIVRVLVMCRSILALLIYRLYWYNVLEYSLWWNSLATRWWNIHRHHKRFTRFSTQSLLSQDKLTDCICHGILRSPRLLCSRSIFNFGGARSLRWFQSRSSLNLYRCER